MAKKSKKFPEFKYLFLDSNVGFFKINPNTGECWVYRVNKDEWVKVKGDK